MPKSTTTRLRQQRLEQRLQDGPGSLLHEQAEIVTDLKLDSSDGSNTTVLQKLGSMDRGEKEWACSALTHLIHEEPSSTLEAFRANDGFTKLIQCLCDTENLVVIAALGLTHALTVSGTSQLQAQVSSQLVDHGVMQPLIKLFEQARLEASDNPEDRSVKSQLFTRLMAVLCNLSSLNDSAMSILCGPNAASIILDASLTPLAQRELYSPESMIYCIQLLAILTDIDEEDDESRKNSTKISSAAFRSLFGLDHINLLKASMANNANPILLRCLIVNTLINLVLEHGNESEILAMLKSTFPIIKMALFNFDASAQLLQLEELKKNTDQNSKAAVKTLDEASQAWKDSADAQGLVLELIANLLVLTDEQGHPNEFEELHDDTEASAMDLSHMGHPLYPSVTTFLVESGTTSQLLPKCLFVPRPEGVLVAEDADFNSLQMRALGCLLNAVLNPGFVSTTLEGATPLWREICDHICAPAMVRQAPVETLNEILHSALGILHQVLRLVAAAIQSGSPLPLEIQFDDFQGFVSIAQNADCHENCRSASISILGLMVAGPWLSLGNPEQVNLLVTQILTMFMQALADPSILIAVESANAIMDAFAEPNFNGIVKQAGLIPRIQEFIVYLKNKISAEKKTMDRMMLDRLDETRINLNRFIKYKQSQ